MTEHIQRRFFQEKRINSVLKDVTSRLNTMKIKLALKSEIIKIDLDIDYLNDKIAVISKEYEVTNHQLKEIESNILNADSELNELLKNRKSINKEYEYLTNFQANMEKKIAMLPEIKEQIKELSEEIVILNQKYKKFQNNENEIKTENEIIEKEIEKLVSKQSMFESEISVMKSTFQIITGLIPDEFDEDTFHEIQCIQENTYNTHINEMQSQIETIKNETLETKNVINEHNSELKYIIPENEKLQNKINIILNEIGSNQNEKDINEEISLLKAKKESLFSESNKMSDEIINLEDEIKQVEKSLEDEKKLEIKTKARLDYLNKRKASMDKLDNVQNEIKRLEKKFIALNEEIDVNNRLIKLTSEIKDETDSINNELYNILTNELDKTNEFNKYVQFLLT